MGAGNCQPLAKGCLQRDSAEHEGYAGVLTDKRITENNNTNADSQGYKLLERILSRENLNNAYKQVKKNKGTQLSVLTTEMSITGYLLLKGFNKSALASLKSSHGFFFFPRTGTSAPKPTYTLTIQHGGVRLCLVFLQQSLYSSRK